MRFEEGYVGWQQGRLTQEEAARLLSVCENPRRTGIAFLKPSNTAFKIAIPPLVQGRVAYVQRCHNSLRW
jgi:hypothetical protein